MLRSQWLFFVLLDAIDALRLQRSYAFANRPGEGNPASVGVLSNAEAWPEAPPSGEATLGCHCEYSIRGRGPGRLKTAVTTHRETGDLAREEMPGVVRPPGRQPPHHVCV